MKQQKQMLVTFGILEMSVSMWVLQERSAPCLTLSSFDSVTHSNWMCTIVIGSRLMGFLANKNTSFLVFCINFIHLYMIWSACWKTLLPTTLRGSTVLARYFHYSLSVTPVFFAIPDARKYNLNGRFSSVIYNKFLLKCKRFSWLSLGLVWLYYIIK